MTVPEKYGYLDTNETIENRVTDLLARMTLDEKLGQIGCFWSRELMVDGHFSDTLARQWLAHGIGEITRVAGTTALRPEASAVVINAIQEFLVKETRLGIPAIVHEESLAGLLARDATCFPQAIGIAATWNPELFTQLADIVRQQMLAIGARHALAPVLDIARDPRWGRTEETLGEDPYLVGVMGTAYVRGLQTDDLRNGIAATGKHFLGYSASEGGLNWAPAHLNDRELREIYALPFEMAIQDGKIATIMNAYHEIDGEPCGSSRKLLVDLLRRDLGFRGALVADYFTLENLVHYHRTAVDYREAARQALAVGMDIELPASVCYGQPLRDALAAGTVDMCLVDAAVANMLRLKFQLGLFENPYTDPAAAPAVFDTASQREVARRVAQESIVLLKNEHDILPLARTAGTIAVIGPAARSIRLLQGDYHYPSHLEVMAFHSPGEAPLSALPRPDDQAAIEQFYVPMVTVLDGIKQQVGPASEVLYAQGCDTRDASTDGFAAAVEAASNADVAIVVVGGKSGLTPACTSGEAVDRLELGLPGVQQQLVEAVAATGTPVVVVLINGRPLAIPWIAQNIPAVIEAWLPGEEAGTAIADVIFGDFNPAGRLPISLPHSVGQVPVFYNHKPSGGRSHWYGNYVDGSTKPLYPFGHGLSYTTFDYANLRISAAEISPDDVFEVSVDITNTGARAGDEVVQLYVRDLVASVTRPVKELKAFKRLTIIPGETRTVTFTLHTSQLAFYDVEMNFVVEPGDVQIMIGASSEDIRLTGQITIVGETLPVRQSQYVTPVVVS